MYFPEFCELLKQMIEFKEGIMGNSDLCPSRTEIVDNLGTCRGVNLVGMSPSLLRSCKLWLVSKLN